MIAGGVLLVVVLLIILSASGYKEKLEQERMILKLIYTFLIGIFLAVFVGVGIAAFYPGPKFPEQPILLKYCSPEITKDAVQYAEFKSQAEKFDKEEKEYQKQSQIYNRNVSIVSLVASIVIVIASLTFFRTILLIADGLLLGGVLTLIYSVMRGFGSEDNMFRFIVVSVGLFISLFLGYIKFIPRERKPRH
ncbi:hypothetical protein A2Z22_03180 [Candidatus Woesebacteria bacterium RBG_16_34_12]|uniref:Uncharacterized protein n=1 Tax=Candidatus Woesebacteria bacterium RBG_16_34_12 TaxID=1802480 RepID=A0A1F7XAN9_9BACT|nr:MAG: hypothetical protein A2Z22_03180 [Candidatus Woesebacteria bacterium RBG_16_34_12]